MRSWGTTAPTLSPIALIATVLLVVMAIAMPWRAEPWTRKSPLLNPVAVTGVSDGVFTLADGRRLRPAGINRRDGVLAADFDHALRVATAQGVVVRRDLGDGTAFFLGEPRFFSTCGTCARRGANRYVQCPVSELLISTGYAIVNLDHPGLNARERWRLEGVEPACGIEDEPTQISDRSCAFRLTPFALMGVEYDELVDLMWKPPPTE